MQEKKFWTLVVLAGFTVLTLVRPEHDLDGRAASRPVRYAAGERWVCFR